MDFRKLPLNQKTTIIAERFLIAVAKRANKSEAVVSYINLRSQKEVLRVKQQIDNDSQILEYIDSDYWDIYADGNYISNYDFSIFHDLEIKVKVNTRAKSLEILGFNNRVFFQINKYRTKFSKQAE